MGYTGKLLGARAATDYCASVKNDRTFLQRRIDSTRIFSDNSTHGVQAFERVVVFYATLQQTAAG